MAATASAPLILYTGALLAMVACRHPETRVVFGGPPNPVLRTRTLETRPFEENPPKGSPDMLFVSTGGKDVRREGGVPESLLVDTDCSVRAVWWATHLCGLVANGNATWMPDKRMGFTAVKFDGVGRSDCPSLVTRFETIIQGLPNGTYRFGTDRKMVEFVISCAEKQ